MVAFLVRIIMRLLYRVEVRGQMVSHEKLLIVSNHTSFLDGILLGAFLPIWPTYLVHTTIAKIWYFKIGLRFLPHLVVDSANPLAMKAIIALLESGSHVVIFPEGRITNTGTLMKVYDGPAFVAARTGATVLPVHIDGLQYTRFSRMTGDFPLKAFPKVRLYIGRPEVIEMPQARRAKERRRLASEHLRKVMQRCAFESRETTTLFPALLDAIDLYGRDREIIEDIKMKPDTYANVLKGALALGRIVSKMTKEGETVAVLMPNVTTTVSLIFGMFAMRRTPAMLNYTAGTQGMQSACRISQSKVLLTSRAFIDKAKLAHVIEGLRDIRVVYLEDVRPMFTTFDKLWLILWALRFPRRVMKRVQPHDPAIVLFTSGSEGTPKGVVLSHDSLLANAAQVRAVIEFGSKDRFMAALPLFHAFGLMGGVFLPLLKGARVFIYPSPLHYRVVPELVYDRDCTVLFSTNTFLANYAKAAHPYDFNRLKYMVVGAEKLSEVVQQLCFEKFGLRILEGYGATECSPVISIATPLAYRRGTVGEMLPGMEYQLAPVAGIEDGGELHVSGPNLMLGYLKDDQPGIIQPPHSAEYGTGWYDTGDVVGIQDYFVQIRGRIRRFAKVAGEMVSLEVVEKIAAAAQPHRQHAAVAIKDPTRGEVIVLFTEDATLRRDQLQAAAREIGAPELAIPKKIVPIEKIPVLGTGKKNYVALNQMAKQGAEVALTR
jgi:acyl-[acyl-carrier-protein]-phospholipid O-acyltransferase/long-chain-fatty-acid--[acyl-carrier-protein] ligase